LWLDHDFYLWYKVHTFLYVVSQSELIHSVLYRVSISIITKFDHLTANISIFVWQIFTTPIAHLRNWDQIAFKLLTYHV